MLSAKQIQSALSTTHFEPPWAMRLELLHRCPGYSQFSKLLPYQLGLYPHKQASRDLNPDEQFWRLSCYLYITNLKETSVVFEPTNTGFADRPLKPLEHDVIRRAQDSNLQALSGQRFSRPLPHHPDTRQNKKRCTDHVSIQR